MVCETGRGGQPGPDGVVLLVVGSVAWRCPLPHRRDAVTVILVAGLPVAAVASFLTAGIVHPAQTPQTEQLLPSEQAELGLQLFVVAVELVLAWFVALLFVLLRWVPGRCWDDGRGADLDPLTPSPVTVGRSPRPRAPAPCGDSCASRCESLVSPNRPQLPRPVRETASAPVLVCFTQATLNDDQRGEWARVAALHGTASSPPSQGEKLGVARSVRDGLWPLNGLRHPPATDACGWYVWAGEELRADDDFFKPVHVEHMEEWCPAALPFLGFPPGWRFLIAPDQQDVWFDPALLEPLMTEGRCSR